MRNSRAKGVTLDELGFEDFALATAEFEHAHLRPRCKCLLDADDVATQQLVVGRYARDIQLFGDEF